MKQRGEITVFLSMCLLCVSALLCVMLESARMAGSRYYFQVAVNSGVDTLFSCYHRQLWEEYQILGLEYASKEKLAEELSVFINQYLSVENWYPMALETVDIKHISGLADKEGDLLAEEVLSCIKFCAINQFMIEPEQGEQLLKDITEAAGAGVLAGEYSRQEKEVRKLEQAVQDLLENVQEQEQGMEKIKTALEEGDEEAFFSTSKSYKKTAKIYSRLVTSYEKRAKELADKQNEAKLTIKAIKPDLQENRGELFEQQWSPYETYIKEQRYQEFITQQEIVEKNLALLREIEILVEETVNKEENEKFEELEHSLEEAAKLWTGQYINSKIVTTANSGDKEKRNLLEQVQRMVEGGLLRLVLPKDMDISQEVIYTGQLPSIILEKSQDLSQKSDRPGRTFTERVLIDEYCGYFFPNALSQNNHQLKYELEYLLQGQATDRENLEKTISELFAVRQGLNLIHILSDNQKREEAKALAFVIAGGIGIGPLVDIMACLVMSIWAMGESIQDLRILMSGGKIPLWKQNKDWNVSLEGLLEIGQNQLPDIDIIKEDEKGFSYEGYLKLLLLKEKPETKHMRMLDLMQLNIEQHQPGFQIQNCAYYVDIQGKAYGKHVFSSLPVMENFINGEKNYSLEVIAEKAY